MATVELASGFISLIPTAVGFKKHLDREFKGTTAQAEAAGVDSGKKFSDGFKTATAAVGHGLLATGGVIGKGLVAVSKAGLAVGAAAASGISAAGVVGVKTAAALEQTEIAFTTMLGSGEKAKAFLSDLSKFAAKTPFDLPGLQQSASSLVSVGIDANKVIPIMTSLGNATSGMGTGAEGVKRATVALQQMNAAGKISGEDLNQLRDAGVPVFELLTAATGKTTAQIAEMAAKGKLGKQELEQLMTALETGKGLERFNGLMDKQSESLGGLLSTFKDTFSVGMAEAVQPLIPLLKDGLGGATRLLTDVILPKAKVIFAEVAVGIRAFGDAWTRNDGQVKSSGFAGIMERVAIFARDAQEAIKKLDFTSISAFFASLGASGGESGEALASIGQSVQSLTPALAKLGDVGGDTVVSGMDVLANVLGFVADNTTTLIALIPFLVGGFLALRAAQIALNFVQQFAIPIQIILNLSRITAAVAERRAAKAIVASTKATQLQTIAESGSIFAKLKANIATAASAVAHKAAAAGTWLLIHATRSHTTAQVVATTTTQMGAMAHLRASAAIVGHRIALAAHAVAAKAAAAGQWLLNAAMTANPMGIVVVALAALTAATIWFFTQTETGREIVKNVWDFIQSAIGGVAGWFNDTLVPNFQRSIGLMGGFFQSLWKDVIEPVFGFIGGVFNAFWLLGKFIFEAIAALLEKVVGPAFVWLWEEVIQPAFKGIGDIIGWVWENVLKPVFTAIWDFVKATLGPAFEWLWKTIIEPAFNGIGAAIKWVWESVIKPVFDTLSGAIETELPRAFETGISVIKSVWEGLQEVVKAPIRFVINTVLNDGLIGAMNGLAEFLGIAKLPRIALPAGFAAGGWTGPGGKYQPAGIVHADEHVIRKESRRRMERTNPGLLDHINATGTIAGYAVGGRVMPLKNLLVTQGYNRKHKGIDFAARVGTPVYATQEGTVSHAGPGARAPGVWGGNEVHVAGGGYETWFAHLSRIGVQMGQRVRAGQILGLSGNTGISSGPHLHFGVFQPGWPNDVDPMMYLGRAGTPSGDGGFNPIGGILDGLMGGFRAAFPSGGIFIDLVGALGGKLIGSISNWVGSIFSGNSNKSGATGAVTRFDGGGWLENTGGPQLIEHNRRRPDAVLSAPQWDTMQRIAEGAASGTQVTFNGPVYGNPQHIVDEMESRKRRAAIRSNLRSITVGG